MELFVIVAGMAIGGWMGYGIAEAATYDTNVGARAICSLIGSVIGGASAYGFLFLIRQAGESAKLPPPRRQFKPQIVGSLCSTCQEKLVFIGDGHQCSYCGRIYCKACETGIPCSHCVFYEPPVVAEIVDAEIDWKSD